MKEDGVANSSKTTIIMVTENEKSAVLTGRRRGGIWYARLNIFRDGDPASVDFDWEWVLEREGKRRDVIGFYHTHPFGATNPSSRDVRTMRAWVGCLGKPLMCAIRGSGELGAWLFETDEDNGKPFGEVQRFPRNVIIGAEGKSDA